MRKIPQSFNISVFSCQVRGVWERLVLLFCISFTTESILQDNDDRSVIAAKFKVDQKKKKQISQNTSSHGEPPIPSHRCLPAHLCTLRGAHEDGAIKRATDESNYIISISLV